MVGWRSDSGGCGLVVVVVVYWWWWWARPAVTGGGGCGGVRKGLMGEGWACVQVVAIGAHLQDTPYFCQQTHAWPWRVR